MRLLYWISAIIHAIIGAFLILISTIYKILYFNNIQQIRIINLSVKEDNFSRKFVHKCDNHFFSCQVQNMFFERLHYPVQHKVLNRLHPVVCRNQTQIDTFSERCPVFYKFVVYKRFGSTRLNRYASRSILY